MFLCVSAKFERHSSAYNAKHAAEGMRDKMPALIVNPYTVTNSSGHQHFTTKR